MNKDKAEKLWNTMKRIDRWHDRIAADRRRVRSDIAVLRSMVIGQPVLRDGRGVCRVTAVSGSADGRVVIHGVKAGDPQGVLTNLGTLTLDDVDNMIHVVAW